MQNPALHVWHSPHSASMDQIGVVVLELVVVVGVVVLEVVVVVSVVEVEVVVGAEVGVADAVVLVGSLGTDASSIVPATFPLLSYALPDLVLT